MRRAEADRLALSSATLSSAAAEAAGSGLASGEAGSEGGWPPGGVAPAQAFSAVDSNRAKRRAEGRRNRRVNGIGSWYPEPLSAPLLAGSAAARRRAGTRGTRAFIIA